MSGYILCQTKKARSPYFIQNISTNIYTLEELCYYLYHNIYLVDQTIINEALCSWIAQELELPRLAAKLRPKLGKFASAEDILYQSLPPVSCCLHLRKPEQQIPFPLPLLLPELQPSSFSSYCDPPLRLPLKKFMF